MTKEFTKFCFYTYAILYFPIFKGILPLPKFSVHYESCHKFMEKVRQNDKRIKLLGDQPSVVYIRKDDYCIGRGPITKVYLGYHIKKKIWVAVKRCQDNNDEAIKNECHLSGDPIFWNQPENIGCYLEVFNDEDEECVYIIIQLYEETLEDYLKKTPDPEIRRNLALGCLRGLEFLHNNGIVHRDLKPTNILVDTSGMVKIVDFGISRKLSVTTYKSVTKGTLNWLPPEVELGRRDNLEKGGDVFVMAMILFYIFSGGEHPFCEPDDFSQANVKARRFRIKLNDLFLQNVIERILQEDDPCKRPCVEQIIHEIFPEV